MRAFHGQFSDNQPIRRNLAEKQKQLRDLKETLGAMKAHTSPALRDSVRKRIAELEAELRGARTAPPGPAPREGGAARSGPPHGASGRPIRSI